MNEFLESKQIIVVEGAFNPEKKFIKDWFPAGLHFEIKGRNAEFFKWVGPGRRDFFLVPLELIYLTNPAPTDRTIPEEFINYPRPDDQIPEGQKLVWDPTAPGLMKLVQLDADTRTDIQRIEDKLDEALAILKEG